MPQQFLSRLAVALCGAGLLAATGPVAAVAAVPASPFSSLFVFGDSLSDAAGGSALPALPFAPNQGGLLIPSPYDNGRVSNGPVAAEVLGSLLGLSPAQQFHYAIAGARTGTGGTIDGTGLQNQVSAFAFGGAKPAYGSGLFMVWAGSNDLRDALDTEDPFASFAGTIGNLNAAIGTLYSLGARNFLLPNIPNLGLTPAAQAQGEAASQGASQVTGLFNAQLGLSFAALAGTLPGAQLYTYDTFGAHNQLFGAAVQQGWNTSNGCLVPVEGAAQEPSACAVSFYVDDIHPTTAVHAVMAQGMAAAVPEPASMLLMAAGAATLLGLGRRRQRRAA